MEENVQVTNPMKVIRLKCLDCCCGQVEEVKLCPAEDCPLHPFRFGKNPYRKKRTMSEEQRARQAEILRNARLGKNS